jgi:hypothetical protein
MPVPETALYPDRGVIFRQDNIWATRQTCHVQAVAQTEVMQGPPQHKFGKANHDVLTSPPAGMSNVTEWAKQQACWNRVSGLDISLPKAFARE